VIDPQVGDRVSEYVLSSPLGAGSFGRVWKAVHHVWKDRVVAVKIPTDPHYVRHLRDEGVALQRLEHPNIVRALGLDPWADPPYFVMEYVDGCSLRALLELHPRGLPVETLDAVLHAILTALAHAHERGIYHRDIKPENVLVRGARGGDRRPVRSPDVRLTDFGLVRAEPRPTGSLEQSGSMDAAAARRLTGTLAYMAPEQLNGTEADARTDLYSLGIVLFEMACGERPSGTETPCAVRPGLPGWVDEVFTRMYARRERRFSSAREALAALASSTGQVWGRPDEAESSCDSCGGPTMADDCFCIHCGTALADPARCPDCRGYVGRDDRYCTFCGASLAAA